MTRALFSLCAVLATASALGAQDPPKIVPAPATPVRRLAGLAAQRIIVTPVYALRQGDLMGWAAGNAKPRAMLRTLDSAIVAEFDDRGMRPKWSFTPDLEHSYAVNPTYAPDPHELAVDRLPKSPDGGLAYTEPLASQLRTLVALHEDGRYVLLPVEVRFEKAGAAGYGYAVLKLVVVDARTVEVRQVIEVPSDPARAFGPAIIASLAKNFADQVISP